MARLDFQLAYNELQSCTLAITPQELIENLKNMYLGFNIRDFRQLLTTLHTHLPHLTGEQKKTNKKFQILVCHL